MIEALWELGKLYIKYDLKRDLSSIGELEDFVDDAFTEEQEETKILAIEFESKNDSFRYKDVSIEDYRPEYKLKYLYRKGHSSAGANVSFSFILAKPGKQSIIFKMMSWFKDEEKNINNDIFLSIGNELNNNNEIIARKINELRPKNGTLVIIKWIDKDKEYYPGDIDSLLNIHVRRSKDKYKARKGNSSKKLVSRLEEGVCSCCANQTEVFGFAFPFTFYTVDNPGFVIGGFKKELSVNNLPICLRCALILEKGKIALNKYFRIKNLFGVKDCYTIPKISFDNDNEEMYWKKIKRLRSTVNSTENEALKKADNEEERVLKYFREENNWLSLGFLFFNQSNSQFEILMFVEDILPSRLSKIYNAYLRVEEEFPEYSNQRRDIFRFLIDILNTTDKKKDSKQKSSSQKTSIRKDYLEILRKILMGSQISKEFIIEKSIQRIRNDFSSKSDEAIKNNESKRKVELEKFTLEKSLSVMAFLDELGILVKKRR